MKPEKAAPGWRWRMLALTWFCIIAYAVTYQCVPPVLGMLVRSLKISHAQAGGLMSLFVLPGIFLAIPGGVLVDRLGARGVGAAALVLMILGTAVSVQGQAYGVVATGRLVAGLGATVLTIISAGVTTAWFEGRELGLAMGLLNTAMPLGTIISLRFLGGVGERWGWQGALWTSMGVCLAALVLFFFAYREPGPGERRKERGVPRRSGIRGAGTGIWWVSIAWALFNAGLLSFFTYAPDYFVGQGLDLSRAGLWAGYPMWGSLVIAPVVGVMIDRIGGKRQLVMVGCAAGALLLYLIPLMPRQGAALALALGVFVALVSPAIFSLPADVVPSSRLGLGFGVLNSVFGIGAMLGPFAVGVMRDASGGYRGGFVLMALFTALGAAAISFLRVRLPHGEGGRPAQGEAEEEADGFPPSRT